VSRSEKGFRPPMNNDDTDDEFGEDETYLGDSVTASHDGYHIVLKANNGEHVIYLDPSVYTALTRYATAHGFAASPEEI